MCRRGRTRFCSIIFRWLSGFAARWLFRGVCPSSHRRNVKCIDVTPISVPDRLLQLLLAEFLEAQIISQRIEVWTELDSVSRFRLRPGENFLETRISSERVPLPPQTQVRERDAIRVR
jgi:hypothetical protein